VGGLTAAAFVALALGLTDAPRDVAVVTLALGAVFTLLATVGFARVRPGGRGPTLGYVAIQMALGFAIFAVSGEVLGSNRPAFGVLLTDNVGEIELASAFDTFGGESLAARTVAVGASREAVSSRHGLSFVPRSDLHDAAPRLDHLLVPGVDAARLRDADLAAHARVEHGLTPQYLHDRPGFPFDAALRTLARTLDVPTARWAAKSLEYPAASLGLTGPAWPWPLALRPLALGLGLAAAVRLDALLRARRRAHS
jgi:hypothetical protein